MRVNHGAITWGDCFIAGTGESGYIAVRPDNPDIVYVGAIGILARRRQLVCSAMTASGTRFA